MEHVASFPLFTKIPCTTNAQNTTTTSTGVQQHPIMTLTMNGVTAFVSIQYLYHVHTDIVNLRYLNQVKY